MARQKNVILTRGRAIGLAIGLSVLLFTAGLLSGLSVSKLLREETARDLSALTGSIDALDSQLRSSQIQEAFINSLNESSRCRFADRYYQETAEELGYYWRVLPSRLERYERSQEPSEEYLLLKDEYTKLSLRAWLVARQNHERCDTDLVPILYFYSAECTQCEAQGQVLDTVKQAMAADGVTVLPFTLDLHANESSLNLIAEYYGVNLTPAMVVNDRVIQGRLFSEAEIMTLLEQTEDG